MVKYNLDDLAVFGGPPAFPDKLHVGRPNIGNRETFLTRVNDMLDRRWLTNHGEFVQQFERRLASFLGVKHAIPVCNGTVGLELAIRALGLSGRVILPSFTFVATAHALQWQEITPVFVDVDPRTHNLDPQAVEAAMTPGTTGIIGVHLWGRPCAIAALEALAQKYDLKLMFDAAHAFGCSHGGRMIGGFGSCEVFSFHATKFFNTFEGGAITTNDDALAARIRLMKNFGFQGYDKVVYLGANGKMTEVCAAMGLTNLEQIEEFVEINRRNHAAYEEGLQIPGLRLSTYSRDEKSNYQYVIAEVDEAALGLERDVLYQMLHAENVIARRYFHPGCHEMEPYRSLYPDAVTRLPQTTALCRRVLALPTGTQTTPAEVGKICAVIRFMQENADQIRQRLGAVLATANG